MNKVFLLSNKVLIPTVLIGPFFLAWFFTQIQFWLGSVIANPVGLVAGLILGIWSASKIEIDSKKLAVAFWLVYFIFLVAGLLFTGTLTVCGNGDCI